MRLIHPIDKVFITQGFGERPKVYAQFGLQGHDGLDYRTRFIDSPLGHRYVMAAADGVIEEIRYDIKGYGIHIRQRLADGSLLIYGHLSKPYIGLKQKVKAGDRIALTGNTGFSTASHLHFEVRPAPIQANNGYAGAVDPKQFLPKV